MSQQTPSAGSTSALPPVGASPAKRVRVQHLRAAKEHGERLDERMDDLMSFVLSDRYAKLRRQIGIAIGV